MKTVIGLDLGTNSIGWSLIESNFDNVQKDNTKIKDGRILGLGSRIIPMDGDAMSKFESGNPESKTANRRQARGARRLLQRYRLRRARLIKTLQLLGWIPESFPTDFDQVEKFNINEFIPFSEATKTEAYNKYKDAGAINEDKKISADWIIYYLRTKAFSQKITLAELARILYHFNQRRGFKSSRKDNKTEKKSEEIKYPIYEKWVEILTIDSITELSQEKGFYNFQIALSASDKTMITEKKRRIKPDWEGKQIEFEVTKITTKAGKITYTITEPNRTDWEQLKIAHEKDLKASGLYVGEYYFHNLLKDRNYRIKQRIIDRSFYQGELTAIWNKQVEFYGNELIHNPQIAIIAETLYHHNPEKQKELKANDLKHLIMNDIIYYQRDLKSQKHLIAECQYEKKNYTNPVTGIQKGEKVAPKSSPIFQEFRIWQTIHNVKVLQKEQIINGKVKTDVDVSEKYLITENKVKLFQLFDSRASVSDKAMLDTLGFKRDKVENGEKVHSFQLNYPTDTDFKGNETKALFRKVFNKHNFDGENIINNSQKLHLLWHIVYSIKDEIHVYNAIKKHFNFSDELAKHISRLPEFKNEYASFSAKAIHKLLPLMRCGEYWNETEIQEKTKQRITNLLTGEVDEKINIKTREEIKKRDFKSISDFQELSTFLACYIVYGRHSERENEEKFENIKTFLEKFNVMQVLPYNSLRNPIVEQITRESLSVVRDICKHYNLLPDEIHIELGRDLKKNNEERQKITENQNKNKLERERIVSILKELKIGNSQSPSDIEKFQIWKDTGGKLAKEKFDSLFKSSRETNPQQDKLSEYQKLYFEETEHNREPSKTDIEKYKLWEEQNYISPYTGRIIPLSKLFTEEYQIEHIIPKARFFDDSFANKTICEAEVNQDKDRMLGMEYIEEKGGKEVGFSNGQKIRILTLNEYIAHIDRIFAGKKKRLFKLSEVPEEFLTRQLNDTRYITRTVAKLLYPIAKDDAGIVFSNGAITSTLKESWGLHKKWKEILKPRFERLEKITGEQLIDFDNEKNDIHFKKDYKRIDHRHHALDALVIACTDRSHIKYLNTLEAFDSGKEDWNKYWYLLKRSKQKAGEKPKMREFDQPWGSFTVDAYEALQGIIVSHKNNKQLITKAINKYRTWLEEENKFGYKSQEAPKNDKYWVAVRKSMFTQPLGQILLPDYKKNVKIDSAIKTEIEFLRKSLEIGKTVNWKTETLRIAKSKIRDNVDKIIIANNFDEKTILKFIKQNPIKEEDGTIIETLDLMWFEKFASKRVNLDASFTKDKIEKMPYANHPKNWLTSLLKEHLAEFENNPKKAFVGENLEQLYKKAPFPINKVTRKEGGKKMFVKGQYVEGDKGTNMYLVIEENIETKERNYYTPNIDSLVSRLASNLPIFDEKAGFKYIYLSPEDIVYVPTIDEIENFNMNIEWKNRKSISDRIYRFVSASGTTCYFLKDNIASLLLLYDNKTQKGEFDSPNKSEKTMTIDNIQIKKCCIKIKVDRLGNIIEADGKKLVNKMSYEKAPNHT
jgi:CRISPR-associated endonuclease Csn1